MDFSVSEDRRILGDSLNRLMADACSFEARVCAAYAEPWHDPVLWAKLSDLGVFYAFLPEASGGVGGSGFDVLAAIEPLGRALCPEPFLGQIIGLRLLAAVGAETEDALAGTTKLAVAIAEPQAPWDPRDIATEAEKSLDGWQISGRKSSVYGGPVADLLLVAARVNDRLGLFQLNADQAARHTYGMIDGGGAAEITLDGTRATCLAPDAGAMIDDALDWGRLVLAAEALGAMEAAFALLVETLKTRQQFGRPLSAFQALQHRSVDLKIALEEVRSITIKAANSMGSPDQARCVAQMKALVGRGCLQMAEETIQMQGGIAMTWDYAASHYAKRLAMIDAQLGDVSYHLTRLAGGGL
ncbi:MAG: acyl-CoA dehydrogenase family protein [Pseudomonadota bacterium]